MNSIFGTKHIGDSKSDSENMQKLNQLTEASKNSAAKAKEDELTNRGYEILSSKFIKTITFDMYDKKKFVEYPKEYQIPNGSTIIVVNKKDLSEKTGTFKHHNKINDRGNIEGTTLYPTFETSDDKVHFLEDYVDDYVIGLKRSTMGGKRRRKNKTNKKNKRRRNKTNKRR